MSITYSPPRPWTDKQPWSAEITFTADGAGAFTAATLPDLGCNVHAGIGVKLDATTPPDALAVTVGDDDGIDMLAGLGATITASVRINVSPPAVFSGGITVTPTGNSTAGAIFTIKLYFI